MVHISYFFYFFLSTTGNSRNRLDLKKRFDWQGHPLADKDQLLLYKCQTDDDGIRLQLTGFPCTLTFINNSDLRMSNSPAYRPWRRLQGFWQTRAFQLFLTNRTWAFPRYQTNNRTVATRRMHDGCSLAFMKSINHDQTWRQKSHEMFARKWLKSLVSAMTQLFPKSWSIVLFLEMPTKSRRSLYIEVVG